MNRLAKLTFAAAALSLGALAALPASADVVVSIKGKSPEEIKTDLRAAAGVVCVESGFRSGIMTTFSSCVDMVYEDAIK